MLPCLWNIPLIGDIVRLLVLVGRFRTVTCQFRQRPGLVYSSACFRTFCTCLMNVFVVIIISYFVYVVYIPRVNIPQTSVTPCRASTGCRYIKIKSICYLLYLSSKRCLVTFIYRRLRNILTYLLTIRRTTVVRVQLGTYVMSWSNSTVVVGLLVLDFFARWQPWTNLFTSHHCV